MTAKSESNQTVLVLLLGFAHMLMYIGYDTGNFVAESALHSVHQRDPSRIISHAGYYGQAISNICYMFGNLAAPLSAYLVRPTRLMAFAAAVIALYSASFLIVRTELFFASCIAQGLMLAMFNAGHSVYITQISTREKLERNSSLEVAIISFSTFFGGIIYFAITLMAKVKAEKDDPIQYIDYSDLQISLLFGVFACAGLLAVLVFAVLPDNPLKDCIASSVSSTVTSKNAPGKNTSFPSGDDGTSPCGRIARQLRQTAAAFVHDRVLLLTPFFVFVGLSEAFWVSVFSTALQFTRRLSASSPNLTAYYAIAVCAGSLIAGALIGPISRRVRDFGLCPLLTVVAGLQIVLSSLLILSLPPDATSQPTWHSSLFIVPNIPLVLLIAASLGALGVSSLTCRTVICTLVLPEQRTQVFAVGRFYQALASCLLFFVTPHMSTYACISSITAICLVGAILFAKVARQLSTASNSKGLTDKIAFVVDNDSVIATIDEKEAQKISVAA